MVSQTLTFCPAGSVPERQELEEMRAHYAAIVESSDDAIISVRLDGTVTSWNPAAERLYGFSAEEMVGSSIAPVIPEERMEEEHEMMSHLGKGRAVSHYETVRRTRSGELVNVSLTASPIPNAAGQVAGVSVIARDITDRKWAEDFYLRFVSIVNSAMDAIISVDSERKIVLFNRAAQRMFGCAASEAMGELVDRFIGPSASRFVAVGSDLPDGGHLGEIMGRRKDGTEMPLETSISSASLTGGKLYTIILRDITERKRVEAVVAQLNEDLRMQAAQLRAANGELEAFSYSVSHDLRAPLRHVRGYVNLLEGELGPAISPKARRYLDTIGAASVGMSNLIDDLLEFSRMGRTQMVEAIVDLGALVEEARAAMESDTRDRQIQWVIAPLPEVRGDPALLRLVLANLIGNAVKYTGKRKLARIEIGTAGNEEGRLVFFVRDNGAGFDPRYADRLFGVFQRLHPSDQFEGTGIGLANVQRIILRHGGRVWAEGAVNEGATFYFTLEPAAA